MSSYFWYSNTGGSEAWKLATSDQRHRIVSEVKPAFVTVLDAQAVPQDDWAREDHLKMKYSGPLYFDWDSQDINKSIKDFQRTLVKLKDDYDVNLDCIRLYATGGRGFHVEIPMEVFVSKPPKDGITQLPYIYREMAIQLATDSLDLKVYSGRKGRMWRVCNVQRDNGHYKVEISVSEAFAMTAESYDKLTSTSRLHLTQKAPEIAVGLQALFAEKRDSVEATVRRNAKIKDERKDLARFNGEFPTSVKLLMAGMHLDPQVGFNNISLQFAILSVAMGKTVDEMLEACEGFCQTHESDGRYNSPRKRKEALRERYHYVDGNPCYVFSFGGLRSICEPGYSPDELAPQELGNTSLAVVSTQAEGIVVKEDGEVDEVATLAKQEEATPDELKAQYRAAHSSSYGGLSVTAKGVFQRRTDGEGLIIVSPTGLMNVRLMRSASNTHSIIGFEATVTKSGASGPPKILGRHEIDYDAFSSKAKLDKMLSNYYSCFRGNDQQAINFRQILTDQTMDNDDVVYVTNREGLDVIPDPRSQGEVKHLMLWSSKKGVVLAEDVGADPNSGTRVSKNFVFRPGLADNNLFDPDVHTLNPLKGGPESTEWISHLLRFSKKNQTIANVLGWFVSCFHRQIHHHIHGQFPLLQFYGQAGSGKSTTPQVIASLFWARDRATLRSASKSSGTPLAKKALYVASCSPPALIDEVKRTELGEHLYAELMGNLRLSYNAASMDSAGIVDGSNDSSRRTVRSFPRSAPICIMSETILSETAVMERSVMVPMSQADQCMEHWSHLDSPHGRANLGYLGALILWHSLRTPLEDFEKMYREERALLQGSITFPANERPLVNTSIVWSGLRFLQKTLELLGIDESERFEELRQSTLAELAESGAAAPTPEVYKALQEIVQMINTERDNEFEMVEGTHYIVKDGYVEIRLRDLLVKYSSWCRSRGLKPFYMDYESLVKALANCDATTDKFCANSPLKTSGATPVFRLAESRMFANGVEPVRSKSR